MSNEGFAKLSNSLHRNEKMIVFGERHPRAFVIWTMAISASSDNQTDGFVSEMEAKRFLGAKKKDILALESEGLWEKTVGGWFIHDYLTLQNSSEEIAKSRQNNAKRQAEWRRNHARESSDSNDKPDTVTRYVTDKTDRDITTDPNTLVTEQNKTKEKENKTKEREKGEPSPKDDFDWEAALAAWEPKPAHYQLANDQVGKGYQLVDVHDLAQEFRLSVRGKRNKYGYEDFDAAFSNWILKRSKDQKPAEDSPSKPKARQVSEQDIQDVLLPLDLTYPKLDVITKRRAALAALKQSRNKRTATEIAATMLAQELEEMNPA